MMTPRKMLGLAVTERSIAAVEVGVAHGGRKVLHAAEFPMPQGESAATPAELGKALRQFLRHNHFSTSHGVIGIEAKWLVAKERTLPRTSADMLAGVLALATERDFASESRDLAFDYNGPVDAGQGQSVLLVAAPRRTVDHLVATAEATGLKVAAVTSSTMALAAATEGSATSRRLVLYLSPGAAELSVQSGGGFRLLRRLPLSAAEAWLDDLAGELRRVIALLPGSQGPQADLALLVWNAAGLPRHDLASLGERLSVAVKVCEFPADLGVADGRAAMTGEFAAATALALAGLAGQRLPVDFVHSKLSPRKMHPLRKKAVWAAALAAVLLIGGLLLVLDWQREEQDVRDLRGKLADMKTSLASAKDIVDKAAYARGWYDRRPRHLECLREVTLAFPQEGRIWTTSLAISEDMRALLSGKASDETAVLEVLDRLSKSPRFSEVKSLYIREVGGGAREVSFAISLNYVGVKQP